jgi:hypothetical protein
MAESSEMPARRPTSTNPEEEDSPVGLGIGAGPVYISGRIGGRRRSRSGNGGMGCLAVLAVLLAFAPATYMHWWSLFVYVPVAVVAVAALVNSKSKVKGHARSEASSRLLRSNPGGGWPVATTSPTMRARRRWQSLTTRTRSRPSTVSGAQTSTRSPSPVAFGR